jgi:two-component system sensor histidine kinase YesM
MIFTSMPRAYRLLAKECRSACRPRCSTPADSQTVTTEDGASKLRSVRRIGVPSQYRYINYLSLEIDYDSVFEPFRNLSKEGYGVLILEGNSSPIFSYNTFNGEGEDFLIRAMKEGNQGRYRVIETGLESSGWTVCYLSDPNSIFGAVIRINNAIYYNVWGALLMLGATALWFISTLVKPIEQPTQNIQRIDNDNMDITVTTNRTDEGGILVRSFSDMIARIKALIEVTFKNEIEKHD